MPSSRPTSMLDSESSAYQKSPHVQLKSLKAQISLKVEAVGGTVVDASAGTVGM